MPYKLIIFDFDGTLADSFPWFLSVINKVATKFRFNRIAPHEVNELRGLDNKALIRRLGVPFWKLPLVAREMRALAAAEGGSIPLFPGTEHLLKGLEESGYRLAVVTSNSLENVQRILGSENSRRIHIFECKASLFGKRVQLRRALKKAGVKPEEAIYIGDETRDIEAARQEKIPSGAVGWGFATPEILLASDPDRFFADMDKLQIELKPALKT